MTNRSKNRKIVTPKTRTHLQTENGPNSTTLIDLWKLLLKNTQLNLLLQQYRRGYSTRAPVLGPCARARKIWENSTGLRAFCVLWKTEIKHDLSTNSKPFLETTSYAEIWVTHELRGKKTYENFKNQSNILKKSVLIIIKTARQTTILPGGHEGTFHQGTRTKSMGTLPRTRVP